MLLKNRYKGDALNIVYIFLKLNIVEYRNWDEVYSMAHHHQVRVQAVAWAALVLHTPDK